MDDAHSYWHEFWVPEGHQLIANYASLCAVELEVNEEITCKRQSHSFMSKTYTSQNNKDEVWKLLG